MKRLLIISLIFTIVLSASTKNLCTDLERKAQECMFIYDPVCAIQKTDAGYTKTTISNRCIACSDVKTEFIVEGACSDYPKEASFCHPKYSEGRVCLLRIDPVCGYFDHSIQCIAPPCGQQFTNNCVACTHKHISYTIPGKCPS